MMALIKNGTPQQYMRIGIQTILLDYTLRMNCSFFASAYHVGEADAVTFYFWGDQMIACHNLIGGEDSLSYKGSDSYNYSLKSIEAIYMNEANSEPEYLYIKPQIAVVAS